MRVLFKRICICKYPAHNLTETECLICGKELDWALRIKLRKIILNAGKV